MRSRLLSTAAAVAAALLLGGPAVAQITLSPSLVEGAMPDKNPDAKVTFAGKVKGIDEVDLLPNSDAAGVFFVYAHNTDPAVPRTLVVILTNRATGDVYGEGKVVSVPADHWQVVKFAKPAAPPAVAPPPAAAPVEPPPPGARVARGPTGFDLTVKLYAEDPQGGNRKEVGTKDWPVRFLSATTDKATYLDIGKLTYTKKDDSFSLPLTPKAKGTVTAKLSFTNKKGEALPLPQTGIYARTLTGTAAQTLSGVFPEGWARMYLSVDGVERVRVYMQESFGDQPEVNAEETKKEVRVFAVGPTAVTKPTAAFPVRVETDNVPPTSKLELRVNRAGVSTADKRGTISSDEVIPLGGPRDERVWVDAAEPTKQGLGFATRTTDWVRALDLTNARGKLTVQAVVRDNKDVLVTSTDLAFLDLGVTVDAVAPTVTDLTVGKKAEPKLEKLTKGKKLPLSATVKDGDSGSGVQKVTFVLYTRLQDDGTFPADAVKADGVQLPELKDGKPTGKMTDTWAADLTPPKADTYKVAVVAVDTAGNPSGGGKQDPALKVIQIVDPTPGAAAARGFISGVVFFAGRPQPGIFVAVGGADGKAKAVVQTDERGKFCIDDVVPGSYTVTTFKPSSGKGFIGSADVTVEADDTAKVTIEMVRVK